MIHLAHLTAFEPPEPFSFASLDGEHFYEVQLPSEWTTQELRDSLEQRTSRRAMKPMSLTRRFLIQRGALFATLVEGDE